MSLQQVHQCAAICILLPTAAQTACSGLELCRISEQDGQCVSAIAQPHDYCLYQLSSPTQSKQQAQSLQSGCGYDQPGVNRAPAFYTACAASTNAGPAPCSPCSQHRILQSGAAASLWSNEVSIWASAVCTACAASLFCVQIKVARTGDTTALGSLKDTIPGETLCDEKHPIMLKRNEFPTDPVISSATGHWVPHGTAISVLHSIITTEHAFSIAHYAITTSTPYHPNHTPYHHDYNRSQTRAIGSYIDHTPRHQRHTPYQHNHDTHGVV